jgi:hypothetical protein
MKTYKVSLARSYFTKEEIGRNFTEEEIDKNQKISW